MSAPAAPTRPACVNCAKRPPLTAVHGPIVLGSDEPVDPRVNTHCLRCLNDRRRKERQPVYVVPVL